MLGKYTIVSTRLGQEQLYAPWELDPVTGEFDPTRRPEDYVGGGMGPSTEQTQAGGAAEGAELTPADPGTPITAWTRKEQEAFESKAAGEALKPGTFVRIFQDPKTVKALKIGGIAALAYAAVVFTIVIPMRIRNVRGELTAKYGRAARRIRKVAPKPPPKGFFARLFGKPTAEKLGQRAEKKSRRRWARA